MSVTGKIITFCTNVNPTRKIKLTSSEQKPTDIFLKPQRLPKLNLKSNFNMSKGLIYIYIYKCLWLQSNFGECNIKLLCASYICLEKALTLKLWLGEEIENDTCIWRSRPGYWGILSFLSKIPIVFLVRVDTSFYTVFLNFHFYKIPNLIKVKKPKK